ncbi:MAG TPA: RDD family protein [Pseudomonadales bacterium]|nr:RDD family protein [Pseudomonadales bacterium]
MNNPPPPSAESAGLFRRLAAMVYDAFLLLALWFLSTVVLVALNGGEALPPLMAQLILLPFIFIVSCAFYSWFWIHSGQTLGMKTWKIRLVSEQGKAVDLKQSLLRILAALLSISCFGLGYVWLLFDKRRCTWHDHLSRTRVIDVSKR